MAFRDRGQKHRKDSRSTASNPVDQLDVRNEYKGRKVCILYLGQLDALRMPFAKTRPVVRRREET